MEIMFFIQNLLAATLRVATPLMFGTMGELFAERVRGVEPGHRRDDVPGSFRRVSRLHPSPVLSGWVCSLPCLAGALAGLLMGFFAVRLGVNQHVSGLGITLLLTSLSLFFFRVIFGENQLPPKIEPFPQMTFLQGVPFIGVPLSQYALTYIAILLVPVVWWVLYRTNFGLNMRAVGENPEAADAAGVNVYRTRYIALAIGGGLMAVGGAFLTLAQLGSFTFGIIAGRGWVCIALIIFANWQPQKVLWGALLFGGIFALQLRLQTTGLKLPYEAFLALPYIVTIIALAFAGRKATGPAAVLKPYRRE